LQSLHFEEENVGTEIEQKLHFIESWMVLNSEFEVDFGSTYLGQLTAICL